MLIPTHSATCAGYYAYFNGRDFHPRGTTPSNFHRGQKWMEWRVETIEQARVQNPMGRGGRREELFPSTVYHRILYILISSTRFDVGSNLRGVWCFYFIKVNAFPKFRNEGIIYIFFFFFFLSDGRSECNEYLSLRKLYSVF